MSSSDNPTVIAGPHGHWYAVSQQWGFLARPMDRGATRPPAHPDAYADADTLIRFGWYDPSDMEPAERDQLAAELGHVIGVCLAGNPAVDGVCGDPDCVCAP